MLWAMLSAELLVGQLIESLPFKKKIPVMAVVVVEVVVVVEMSGVVSFSDTL